MDVGGTQADRATVAGCVSSVVPISACRAAEYSPHSPTPHPAPRAGVHNAGPGGGRDRSSAAQDRWADRGPVLVGGVASHGAPPVGPIGTEWHNRYEKVSPKSLILHAPRLIRTADLLIRSRTPNPHVRAVSRTSGDARSGRAHEKDPKIDQIGTTLAQPSHARNVLLARMGRGGCACGQTDPHPPSSGTWVRDLPTVTAQPSQPVCAQAG